MVSDAKVARHILFTNAPNYSKGVLSEILDFVMGSGEVTAKHVGKQRSGSSDCSMSKSVHTVNKTSVLALSASFAAPCYSCKCPCRAC